jgi:hypothetical protein
LGRPPGEVPPAPVFDVGLLEGEWEEARMLVLVAWAEWLIWLALPPGIGSPRVWRPVGGGLVATGMEPDPVVLRGGGERMVELVGEEESEGGWACGSL